MPYEKQTWANGSAGGTPINEDRLNHIEAGIEMLDTGTVNLPAPTGDSDIDDAALAAAIVETDGRGVIVAWPGTYAITSHHEFTDGIDLQGAGGGPRNAAKTIFLGEHADAQLEFSGGGGVSSGFQIDGNLIATTPFRRSGGTNANARTFINVQAKRNLPASQTNDLAEFHAAQNDLFINCGFFDADRDLAYFDQGFGGATFLRCQWSTAGRYHHYYDDAITEFAPYLYPSDIKHINGICEGNSGISIIKAAAAGNIVYNDHPLYSADGCSGPMVDLDDGEFSFLNPFLQNTPSTLVAGSIGIMAHGSASATLIGREQYLNLEDCRHVDGLLAFIYDMGIALAYNYTNLNNASGGATVQQIGQVLGGPTTYALVANTDYALMNLNIARNAMRFGIRSKGRLDWFPGTNFTPDVNVDRRAVGAIGMGTAAGNQQLFCMGAGTTAQRPGAAAALEGALYVNHDTDTVDQCDGTTWHVYSDHTWVNATTSGITTNPAASGAPVGYTKTKDGLVVLRGYAASVSIGAGVLFTLPAGFRPGYYHYAPILSWTGGGVLTPAWIAITAAGAVTVPVGAGGFVNFANVQFLADN